MLFPTRFARGPLHSVALLLALAPVSCAEHGRAQGGGLKSPQLPPNSSSRRTTEVYTRDVPRRSGSRKALSRRFRFRWPRRVRRRWSGQRILRSPPRASKPALPMLFLSGLRRGPAQASLPLERRLRQSQWSRELSQSPWAEAEQRAAAW
jgi:hypothetical protein